MFFASFYKITSTRLNILLHAISESCVQKVVVIFENRGIINLHANSENCVQKVGDSLDAIKLAATVFESKGEVVKAADLLVAGLKKWQIKKLCDDGAIMRVRNGYYCLPQKDAASEEVLIATLLPQAVICMESALFHYGYSDFAPRQWTVAVPRSASRAIKQMTQVPIKAYYVPKEYLGLGKNAAKFNDTVLPIYDRERTICDCFRFRTRLDSELFNKAVNAYVADPMKNLRNLAMYAKQMKIYEKVMNVMEVLLNG